MTTLTFDALRFVRRLKDAGMPENQAEAISEAFREAQDTRLTDLTTRQDLRQLELKLSNQIAEAKIDIIKWVIGASGIMVAAIKLLPGNH